MEKGTFRAEATSNSEKIKPIALAIVDDDDDYDDYYFSILVQQSTALEIMMIITKIGLVASSPLQY